MKSFINFLPPWVETNIQPAFYDKESGTCLQQTARMYAKVNQLVRCFNELSKEVQDYIKQFTELRTFVEDYFENLDVQEEINNKLDEMTEDGTLQEIVGDYILTGMGRVKYIFPSKTLSTSEYALLNGYNKNVLLDTGNGADYLELKTTLSNNDVTHVDYVLITHFHGDHVGNLISLYEDGYCDNTTTLILPPYDSTKWSSDSSYSHYVTVMAYLSEHEIPYSIATERQVIQIADNFSIKIFNTVDSYNEYNECSLIFLTQHFDKYGLFTGDAYKETMENVFSNNDMPQTYAIYKMNHHGIDFNVMIYRLIIEPLTIENVVQVIGINDLQVGKGSNGGNYCFFKEKTNNLFVTAYNSDNITFTTYVNNCSLEKGLTAGVDNFGWASHTLYVDSSYTSLDQDGTQEKPFTNLTQALGYIDKDFYGNYTISIADGTYSKSSDIAVAIPRIYASTNKISIEGHGNNTILNYGFNITGCTDITIKNLKIVNKMQGDGIAIESSNVKLENVTYETHEDNDSHPAINISANSNVTITGCNLSKATYGIRERESNVEIYNTTFSDISSACLFGNLGNFVITRNITVSDTSNLYSPNNNNTKANFTNGLELYSGSHTYSDGNITCLTRGPRFNKVAVEYELTFGTQVINQTQYFNMNGETKKLCLNPTYMDSDGTVHIFAQELDTKSDTNTFVFNYSRHCAINTVDGTYTRGFNDNTIVVKKIIAY